MAVPTEVNYDEFRKSSVYRYERQKNGPTNVIETPLPQFAQELFLKIQTPADVCEHARDLVGVLIDVHLFPYSEEYYSTCKALDIHDFHRRVNFPVAENRKQTRFKDARIPEGNDNIRNRDERMNVDQDERGKQPERSMSENRRGRNDIMLDHITANGFAEELAKRLWADYEERICEVRRVIGLATQAIENAQKNTTNTMKEAVAVLLSKAGAMEVVDPKRASMNAEVTPYNVEGSDRYLLLAWLKSLSGEHRRQAAEAIIARMRELAGNDDDIVARNLTGFSNEVYESMPVAPFDNYRTCWKYDYGQDFAEEVDLLWSVLLEKKVDNVYPRLRELLGEGRMWAGQRGRDLKDFSLHEVKETFKEDE